MKQVTMYERFKRFKRYQVYKVETPIRFAANEHIAVLFFGNLDTFLNSPVIPKQKKTKIFNPTRIAFKLKLTINEKNTYYDVYRKHKRIRAVFSNLSSVKGASFLYPLESIEEPLERSAGVKFSRYYDEIPRFVIHESINCQAAFKNIGKTEDHFTLVFVNIDDDFNTAFLKTKTHAMTPQCHILAYLYDGLKDDNFKTGLEAARVRIFFVNEKFTKLMVYDTEYEQDKFLSAIKKFQLTNIKDCSSVLSDTEKQMLVMAKIYLTVNNVTVTDERITEVLAEFENIPEEEYGKFFNIDPNIPQVEILSALEKKLQTLETAKLRFKREDNGNKHNVYSVLRDPNQKNFKSIFLNDDDMKYQTTKIPEKLKVLHPEMRNMSGSNLNQSYVKSGMFEKDFYAVLDSITMNGNINIETVDITESSSSFTDKYTVSMKIKDTQGRYTIKFDMPKIDASGYIKLGGVKWHPISQIIALPVIKIKPDEVLITTAYNKVILNRFGRNTVRISLLNSFLKDIVKEGNKKVIVKVNSKTSSAYPENSAIELQEISQSILSVETPSFIAIFNPELMQDYISTHGKLNEKGIAEFQQQGYEIFAIDKESKTIYFIDSMSQIYKTPAAGKLTHELIDFETLIINSVQSYTAVKPKEILDRKSTFIRVKMFGKKLPLILLLGFAAGLFEVLRRYEIKYEVIPIDKLRSIRSSISNRNYYQFADFCILTPSDNRTNFLLAGLEELSPEQYDLSDFSANGLAYKDYILKYGTNYIKAMSNFKTSFVDPMTASICESYHIPSDFVGLFLYAANLLSTNAANAANDISKNYYIRPGTALINAIAYKTIHREIEKSSMTGNDTTTKISIPPNEVIKNIQLAQNVTEVNELNPILEFTLRDQVSFVGAGGGMGETDMVSREMRATHPSMMGLFSYQTPDNSSVGVTKHLTYNCKSRFANARGILKDHPIDDTPELMGAGELLMPQCMFNDPPRINMGTKQLEHTLVTEHNDPPLLTTGIDKLLAFGIGDTFAYKAPFDGKVTKNTPEYIDIVDAKGTTVRIDKSYKQIKNSGGGFFQTTKLENMDKIKIGCRFKEGDILAYDPKFFVQINDDTISYKTGVLTKVAITPLDMTYEDSIVISEKLAVKYTASITMQVPVTIPKDALVSFFAKAGQKTGPNDPLVMYESSKLAKSTADMTQILSSLDNDIAIRDLMASSIVAKAKYDGEIVEVKLYHNIPEDSLTPLHKRFIKASKLESEFINRDRIMGKNLDGFLALFYIRVRDEASVGDKVTTNALKGIISTVLKQDETPIHIRKDGTHEEIDYIVSPLSIVSRMTAGAFIELWSDSVLLELRKKAVETYFGKQAKK